MSARKQSFPEMLLVVVAASLIFIFQPSRTNAFNPYWALQAGLALLSGGKEVISDSKNVTLEEKIVAYFQKKGIDLKFEEFVEELNFDGLVKSQPAI
jgi:hypothetical protein